MISLPFVVAFSSCPSFRHTNYVQGGHINGVHPGEKQMKIYKFVTYASLIIVSSLLLLIASAPLRFPGDTIGWRFAFLLLVPAVLIVMLLFIKPLVPVPVFRAIVLVFAALTTAGALSGWLPSTLLAVVLVACLGLYLSTGAHQPVIHPQ
jgi:hypothetical protein